MPTFSSNSTVSVLSALLTPIIALLAVYIAWQQHKTNRDQFRLALLERRLKVFNAAGVLIATVVQRGKISQDDLTEFLWETREDDFLFGSEITEYLHELYAKASTVFALEGAVDQEPRTQRKDALVWFAGQGDEIRRRFSRYMAFRGEQRLLRKTFGRVFRRFRRSKRN